MRVPPKLMAGARRSARQRGKSDAIDAIAVARAALREPELPVAALECASREIRLLLDHRDDLVGERTRIQQRLRWHLYELEPELEIPAGALDRQVWLDRVARKLARREQTVQVRICRELVRRIVELTRRERELERELRALVQATAPTLLELPGCGVLTAAKLIGEIAGAGRRHHPPARAYLARKQAEGKSRKEALRCLKRHLARSVYRILTTTKQTKITPTTTPVLAPALT